MVLGSRSSPTVPFWFGKAEPFRTVIDFDFDCDNFGLHVKLLSSGFALLVNQATFSLFEALASYPYPDLTLVILVILAFPFALYLSLQQSQYIWPDPFTDEAYPCSVPPPD
ncbi:uncharacterized protein EDB93DRAFT_1330877 [Suillus bovinus]|uniref:uncharacterized protein n=1 Tax=Suillus bovinus TaxID=48563 RepID=UPI001B87502F|nr:uncharacterized protein EDB93DRAFT_1330877 [Suillus bovinus]KAG2136522.1 hypothetical protein EDB93DRAFT_1330877 [Suillus bovinus]